jgi:hypothetical protein
MTLSAVIRLLKGLTETKSAESYLLLWPVTLDFFHKLTIVHLAFPQVGITHQGDRAFG